MKLTRRTFTRGLTLGALTCTEIVSPAIIGSARAQSISSNRPDIRRGTYLIRNGAVMTVDPSLGTLPKGDVLVREGVIERIGQGIEAPGAEIIDASDMIVMPGLIDTHYHMWSALGRNFPGDNGFSYFPAKNAISPYLSPQDGYNSVMLGLAELANNGVTTVHNWSNNTRSAAHADAELTAHRDSLLRARFAYGHADLLDASKPFAYDDILRTRDKWFGAGSQMDGLVHFAVNLRGMGPSKPETFHEEMQWVLKNGLRVATHAGQSPPNLNNAADFEQRGYLGPNFLFCHYVPGTEADFEVLARTKTPLSFATISEMRLGRAGDYRASLMLMRKAGVMLSLSVDASLIGAPNMFEIMRTTWNLGVPWQGTPSAGQKPIEFAEVIRMATINGAISLGLGDVTGSLTPGKRADIILLRTSDLNMAPLGQIETTIVQSADPSNVDTVMIDGRIVKRAGRLVGYDVAKIVADAKDSARKLRKQAGGVLLQTCPDCG